MSPRNWHLFVEDILESIEKIRLYVDEMSFEEFKSDPRTIDAVARNLEVIGEAARQIPDDVKIQHPKLDWNGMVGLRNRIAHEYFGLSLPIIWTIIQRDVPELEERLRSIK
jgi:uncharacterized protein with HEPN domain